MRGKQAVKEMSVRIAAESRTVALLPAQRGRTQGQKERKKARRKESELRGVFRQEVVFSGKRISCEGVERHLISCYGSVVSGGLLFNFTPGGDGGIDINLLSPEAAEKVIQGGVTGSRRAKELGVGFWSPDMQEIRVNNGRISGKAAVESGQLEVARTFIDYDSMREDMKKRGENMGKGNKGKVSITNGIITKMIARGEEIPEGWRIGDAGNKRQGALKSAFTVWEDPDHPELGRHNAGNLVKRQKSLNLSHSKENRRKVNGN